jgi:molybdopterin/thiamine biosynthesis adenylyltransferase
MSGVRYLYLFDADEVEESNRNRLPFCQGAIGRPKVEVVAEFIRAIRPDCTVVPIKEKMEGIFINVALGCSTWIIECTDSPVSQKRMYRACKNAHISFIRAGYDGTRMTVTSNVSGWIKDEEETNYEIAPSWAVPAVTVAALAVGKMMKFFAQEVSLDLSEIGVPILEKSSRLTSRCK